MKKFIFIIMLLILVLSFSACWATPDVLKIETDEAKKLIRM